MQENMLLQRVRAHGSGRVGQTDLHARITGDIEGCDRNGRCYRRSAVIGAAVALDAAATLFATRAVTMLQPSDVDGRHP